MATLVLSAAGMLVGGPLGGAFGALLGGALDRNILGPRHEGPRLKDIKVSGSSYGDPVARHFGKVRAPGIIIWSTDLKEHSEKSGDKGKPKTTSYSYSISFAVLLSSARIDRVHRIWADGNLLRGAAGDLKTQGQVRIHTGQAHQAPDPLLAAALGAQCPAFRDCAYAVFEDLSLSDFGNRIPALSFEIEAGSGKDALGHLAGEAGAAASMTCPGLQGFSYEGGSIAQNASLLGSLYPHIAQVDGEGEINLVAPETTSVHTLAPAAAWNDGDFGQREGSALRMGMGPQSNGPGVLRYYDAARDYQPGLQRVTGANGAGATGTLEIPAVLSADTARHLVGQAYREALQRRDRLSWRTSVLDPAIRPGSLVRAPGIDGVWRVGSWEWRTGGVELDLERYLALPNDIHPADPGSGWHPRDRQPQPSILRAFELPWDGFGPSTERQIFVAASAGAGLWNGGVLYGRSGDALMPLLDLPARRTTVGHLAAPLPGSTALRLEKDAVLQVQLLDPDAALHPASPEDLARGANRARVGHEILQFSSPVPVGDGKWLLRGLLRGRGGTETLARCGWPQGAQFTLLDEALVALPAKATLGLASSPEVATVGLGDAEAVHASIEGFGTTLRPLSPVHPRFRRHADGSVDVAWTRRARGAWDWANEAEAPLVEESELYQIGLGTVTAPLYSMLVTQSAHAFTAAQWDDLTVRGAGSCLWVRQCGRFARSETLELHQL